MQTAIRLQQLQLGAEVFSGGGRETNWLSVQRIVVEFLLG